MEWLHDIFTRSPEIALFLSLALGYTIGKVGFGRFQLGGVAGSLLVAVIVSQAGVEIDSGAKTVLFALFIYAVGFESGPQFFGALGKQSVKEIVLAFVLAATGLATVIVMARLCGFDKGLAAGLAAGGLTQSAIIGTAGDAIAKLGLAAEEVQRLQGNVAVGYAVTYIFGTFGAIIVCVNILPRFMGRSIRDDAIKAEAELQTGVQVFGPDQQAAAPDLVGRLYQVSAGRQHAVAQIEHATPGAAITIERVKRGEQFIEVAPQLLLEADDVVLVVGRREGVVASAGLLGKEVYDVDGMELIIQRRDVVVTRKDLGGRALGEIRRNMATAGLRRGVYLEQISRMGQVLPIGPDLVVQVGDTVTLHGVERDVQRVASAVGEVIVQSAKTDFVYLGAGVLVGLLIGLVSLRLGGIPLTLGSGGGALLSGLLFGWYRARRQTFGDFPIGAVQLLKELGLAGFVAVVGLQSGLQAVTTMREHGLAIFGAGVVVTIVPLLLTMLVGRYVLRYDNVAILAGALSGTRSANPAFGEVLDKAGNPVPTVPFAITYALANVLLTLLGPLVVALA